MIMIFGGSRLKQRIGKISPVTGGGIPIQVNRSVSNGRSKVIHGLRIKKTMLGLSGV